METNKNNKTLLYISLFILGWIAIVELGYIGKTSLAWVIIGLAIAVGLQAIYLIKK